MKENNVFKESPISPSEMELSSVDIQPMIKTINTKLKKLPKGQSSYSICFVGQTIPNDFIESVLELYVRCGWHHYNYYSHYKENKPCTDITLFRK